MAVPLVALHKNAEGQILDAGAFDYSYKLSSWLQSVDVRVGDRIEFIEKAARPAERPEIIEPPAFVPEARELEGLVAANEMPL